MVRRQITLRCEDYPKSRVGCELIFHLGEGFDSITRDKDIITKAMMRIKSLATRKDESKSAATALFSLPFFN